MRVYLAAGGTGGHIFPGIALAEAFQSKDPGTEVIFVGTKAGLEKDLIPRYGYHLRFLSARGLKGKGWRKTMISLLMIPWACIQSLILIWKDRPDIIIGIGGYASGPVMMVATMLRIPTAVLEPNSIPGFTNKILGRRVSRVFVAFDQARQYFSSSKTMVSGTPVRTNILQILSQKKKPFSGTLNLLVFGGSQGARSINHLVTGAISLMGEDREKLAVVHQTGAADYQSVTDQYRQDEFDARVEPFIEHMESVYEWAHLVIARAGATSVAELTALGKPSVLIPFPFAADNHQEYNARLLSDHGGAIMMREKEATVRGMAELIRTFIQSQGKLEEMGKKAGLIGKPEAATQIVEECYRLIA